MAARARLAVLAIVLLGLQEFREGIVLLLKLLYQLFLGLEFLRSLLDLLDEDHVISAAVSELLVEALDLQILASVAILTLQLLLLGLLLESLVLEEESAELVLDVLLLLLLLILGILQLQDMRKRL